MGTHKQVSGSLQTGYEKSYFLLCISWYFEDFGGNIDEFELNCFNQDKNNVAWTVTTPR